MAFNQRAYMNQYNKEMYDTVSVRVQKGTKQEWKEYAESRGLSLVELIRRAVSEYIEKN